MSNLKVEFTDVIQKTNHMEYVINIIDTTLNTTNTYTHRYSVLRNLYESLKKFSKTPSFPPKTLFKNKNLKFLQKRKKDLESFFSSCFSSPQLSKFLLSSPCFMPRVASKSNISQTTNDSAGLCKTCIRAVCWEAANKTCDKLIDLSCHPGSLNESEIKEVMSIMSERCKDIKIAIRNSGIGICDDEELVGSGFLAVPQSSAWVNKAFSECFDNIEKR